MRTKEYLKLIKEKGWVLKSYKNFNFSKMHSYCVVDPSKKYYGYCKYINKTIFDNLVKQGIVPIITDGNK